MKAPWFALFLAAIGGCSQSGSQSSAGSEPNFGSSAPSARKALEDAASAAPAAATKEQDEQDAGWTRFARQNDVPLCLFARYENWYEAKFQADVKDKVSLKAGQELHFGTYAPGCAGRDCLREVTLQCWVDMDGKAITVHTRFSGLQNLANTCSEECQSTTAQCNTPELPAGTYTLTYGDRKQTLRIPGVVRKACW
jgi:hypothetical protein